jgi:protein-tyrosine phosphatase
MIDIHTHLIPGVDDGAATLGEAHAALAELARQEVHAAVATPHLDGSLTRQPERLQRRLAELDAGWTRLLRAGERHPRLRLERGVELMLDTPDPDLSDPRLRLGGTSFVLVEFAGMTVPPGETEALRRLAERGWRPVVAHPERYPAVQRDPARVAAWREAGCHLQVNAGSLLGRYGNAARAAAFELLRRGAVSYLASDHHARGTPHLEAARERLRDLGGSEQGALLLAINPERLLNDEPPLEVPALPPGLLRRMLPGWWGGRRSEF